MSAPLARASLVLAANGRGAARNRSRAAPLSPWTSGASPGGSTS
ncbi:hypothetical protein HMPREF1868_00166 [Olsenella sp. DNF00959]|nr:hypothetical protein HMPREF1868_00166 [Olsenella sp. DNF00959]